MSTEVKCKKCGNVSQNGNTHCVFCGEELPAETESLFDRIETNSDIDRNIDNYGNGNVEQEKTEQELQKRAIAKAYLEKQNSLSDNYLLGLLGALVGALVAAIPWAVVSSQGWFVAWLGYLIAIVASKGYDLMKVKTNMKKLWCVLAAVVIGVFAGQIMSDMIVIATDEELGHMFSDLFSYYANNFGEYLSINIKNLALGYVFAALGSLSVFVNIKKETAIIESLK